MMTKLSQRLLLLVALFVGIATSACARPAEQTPTEPPVQGDAHGLWTFIYDVYGNLWYERPLINSWISLPGNRVYVVKVGNTVRKVYLN